MSAVHRHTDQQQITSSHRLLFEVIDRLRDDYDQAIASRHPEVAAVLLDAIRVLIGHLDQLATERQGGEDKPSTGPSSARVK
jgi:hypothetical protein